MYILSFKLISQNMYNKSPENFSEVGSPAKLPLPCGFVCQKAKNCPSMTKINGGHDTHYISVYKNWWLRVTFEAMNAEKWLWPIFGSKVGQSIRMKLKLNLWHRLLNLYTKLQIDTSNRVEKSLENFEKSKMRKNNRQNSEKNGSFTVLMQCWYA